MTPRRRLAFAAAAATLCSCATRPPLAADYAAHLDADLQRASAAFMKGELSGSQYLALSIDRAGKARRLHTDPAWREAAARGDRDHDGVPDAFDRCDNTALNQPTDEHGCPLRQQPACTPGEPRQPGCDAGDRDDRRTRDLASRLPLLFNAKCDGAPAPQVPNPLEWGRGAQTVNGTAGFNLALLRVDNQPAACELFYEIEVRLETSSPAQVRYVNVLFKAAEDLRPGDASRVVFGLPMLVDLTVTPSRAQLRDFFGQARPLHWRARAINGAQRSSAWSAVREQGPASGGVAG